jgi:hypothetical protein
VKKFLIVFLGLALVSCIQQTVNTTTTYWDNYSVEEVWIAAIRAVNDIDFTIDSLDKDAGFIGAESGTHIGQEVPPRLSIMIQKSKGRVFVDCKVLQKEQFIDLFGHGRKISQRFLVALNKNLNMND